MVHDHYFEEQNDRTIMKDVFQFEAPLSFIGKLFSAVVLTKYMSRLLENRNRIIKEYAETNKAQSILKLGSPY